MRLNSSDFLYQFILDQVKIEEGSWLSLHSVILTCLAFLSLLVLLEWRKRSQEGPQITSIMPWNQLPRKRLIATVLFLGCISVIIWILTANIAVISRNEFFAILVGFSCGMGAVWSGGSKSRESAAVAKIATLILSLIAGTITFLWQDLPTAVPYNELQTDYAEHLMSGVFLIIYSIIGYLFAQEVVMSASPSTYSLHDFFRYLVPTITYSTSGIWKHKRRSLNLIIAVMLSIAMFTTLAIWLDRAPEVAIHNALDERDFHFSVQRQGYATGQVGNPGILRQIENYLDRYESLVSDAELVYNTIALFGNISSKPDTYDMRYAQAGDYNASADQIYATRVAPNQQAQLVSENFIDKISRQLRLVNGSFDFGGNKVLMSRRLQSHINESIGLQIYPDESKNISISLVRNDIDPEIGETGLGFYNRIDLNVTVVGIVERIPARRLTYSAFNEETLGDGFYISKDFVGTEFIDDIELGTHLNATNRPFALVFPRLYARLDKDVVNKLSWRNLRAEMRGLENRIRAQGTAQWFAAVFWEMDEVYNAIDLYKETRWVIVFLLVPIVVLSVILTIMTVTILNKSRKDEIRILRTRGGDSFQVTGSVLLEIVILGYIGSRIGESLGMLLAAMIPTTKRFLEPNFSDLPDWQELVTGSSQSPQWWATVGLFEIALLAFLMVQTYFQVRGLLLFPTSGDGRGSVNPVVAFISDRNLDLILLLIGFPALFWLVDSDILARTFSDQEFLALHLTFAVFLWLGFAAVTSRIMSLVIAKADWLLTGLFGASAFVIVTNLKRRQYLISMLAFIATVTFSIGIFASIYNETMWTNTSTQAEFTIGSDYKVMTSRVPLSMSTAFQEIEGIDEVMPMPVTSGSLGDGFVALIGVDALQYARIAHWDDSAFDVEKNRVSYLGDGSFVWDPYGERRDYKKILEDLENTIEYGVNGIIINQALATDLRLQVGDPIQLGEVNPLSTSPFREVFFEIVAIAYSAPGFGILSQFSERPLGTSATRSFGGAIVNSYFLVDQQVTETNVFLLKGASAANKEEIVSSIRENEAVQAVYYVDYFNIEDEGFLALGGVPGILTIDFLGSLAIIAFSLGVFLEFIISERRQEYALLRAVGATKRQVSKSVVGEFLGIAVISLAIGGLVSLIFSLAFLELSVGHLAIFKVLPYSIFIPIPSIGLTVFLVFIFLMLGSLWPSRRASQTQIADVLRNL
ncbi:MAG: FtsX-like permease family protein [Candidatus Hodarchaeales archaeon]